MYGPVMQDTFESCHGDRTEAMRLQTRATGLTATRSVRHDRADLGRDEIFHALSTN